MKTIAQFALVYWLTVSALIGWAMGSIYKECPAKSFPTAVEIAAMYVGFPAMAIAVTVSGYKPPACPTKSAAL